MTDSPAGARIVTLLDEVSIAQLLLDVSQQVSQSQYLFLPHPGSLTAYAAAPQEAPAFVEVITEFRIEQTPQFCTVTPVISWRVDSGTVPHPASEMIVAEFRYAVSQVDPSAYELASDDAGQPHTAPTLPGWSATPQPQPTPPAMPTLPQLPAPVQQPAPPGPSPQFAPAATSQPQPAPQQPAPQPQPQPVQPPVVQSQPPVAQQPQAWLILGAQNLNLPLEQQNILGRKPSAHPQRPAAQLVTLPDPARSLSKTHAILELSGQSVWVTDLGSTNGTRIISALATVKCVPNTPVQLLPGTRLMLGEVETTVVFSET